MQPASIMRKPLLDMKDGVPTRDGIGIAFSTSAEAISDCSEIAQDLRNDSRWNDRDLEISVINDDGREIHRERVRRAPE